MKTFLLFSIFFFTVMFSRGQWRYTDLIEAKYRIGVTSLGTKAYFAGGQSASGQVSAVEIFDVEINDWDTIINLFIPRSHIACVSSGTKVFFAGGADYPSVFYDMVDIWDTENGQWSWAQLLAPRFSLSAVSAGNKVMFAGGANLNLGICYDLVDIYDTETGEWSTTTLSMARCAMGAAVVGDVALFAGGYDLQNVTDRVDIFQFSTKTWSTASLSQARGFLTATTVGTKVLFAGGTTNDNESSDRVDIYDSETGEWSTANLSQPRAFWEGNSATLCDEKAYFVGGGIMDLNTHDYYNPYNVIDIYDATEDTWTTDTTIIPLIAHAVVGIDNHLLIAGGLSYEGIVSTLQIFTGDTCISASIPQVQSSKFKVQSYPNPFASFTTLEYELEHFASVNLSIYNHLGQQVAVLANGEQNAGKHQVQWNANGLPAGVYFYLLRAECIEQCVAGKIVKY